MALEDVWSTGAEIICLYCDCRVPWKHTRGTLKVYSLLFAALSINTSPKNIH